MSLCLKISISWYIIYGILFIGIKKSNINRAQVFLEGLTAVKSKSSLPSGLRQWIPATSKYLTFSLCDHADLPVPPPAPHSPLFAWRLQIWTARATLSGNEQCVSRWLRAGPELTCPYARSWNLAPVLHHLLLSFLCVCVWDTERARVIVLHTSISTVAKPLTLRWIQTNKDIKVSVYPTPNLINDKG